MTDQQLAFENLIAECSQAVFGAGGQPLVAENIRPFLVRAYEQGVQDQWRHEGGDGDVLPSGPHGSRSFPMSGQ